jgi:hypothetical protein
MFLAHSTWEKGACVRHKTNQPAKNKQIYMYMLEDITTKPHAQEISADFLRVWLSGYILQHLQQYIYTNLSNKIILRSGYIGCLAFVFFWPNCSFPLFFPQGTARDVFRCWSRATMNRHALVVDSALKIPSQSRNYVNTFKCAGTPACQFPFCFAFVGHLTYIYISFMYVCMCVYMYIYIYIHTHSTTRTKHHCIAQERYSKYETLRQEADVQPALKPWIKWIWEWQVRPVHTSISMIL